MRTPTHEKDWRFQKNTRPFVNIHTHNLNREGGLGPRTTLEATTFTSIVTGQSLESQEPRVFVGGGLFCFSSGRRVSQPNLDSQDAGRNTFPQNLSPRSSLLQSPSHEVVLEDRSSSLVNGWASSDTSSDPERQAKLTLV